MVDEPVEQACSNPECARRFRVRRFRPGRSYACTRCGSRLAVPARADEATITITPEDLLPDPPPPARPVRLPERLGRSVDAREVTRGGMGTRSIEILSSVLRGEYARPSELAPGARVPRELEAVVEKAMAFRPRDRYPSVTALQTDVEAYLAGGLLAAARYSPLERARKWLRRHRLATGVAAAVLGIGALWGTTELVRGASARAEHGRDVERARERIEARRPVLAEVPRELAGIAVDPADRDRPSHARAPGDDGGVHPRGALEAGSAPGEATRRCGWVSGSWRATPGRSSSGSSNARAPRSIPAPAAGP